MQLNKFDHVSIVTANLDAMVDWYTAILGMENGGRPPFPFPGAWLYVGGGAVVHLVGMDEQPNTQEPRIEHFAFTATGLSAFIERLEAAGIVYQPARVPGLETLQINLHDCDGNHIHIDFTPEEADTAGS